MRRVSGWVITAPAGRSLPYLVDQIHVVHAINHFSKCREISIQHFPAVTKIHCHRQSTVSSDAVQFVKSIQQMCTMIQTDAWELLV